MSMIELNNDFGTNDAPTQDSAPAIIIRPGRVLELDSAGPQTSAASASYALADPSERLRRAYAALDAAGFSHPETLFPPGTSLLPIGQETQRSRRAAWESKPRMSEVTGILSRLEAAEGRRSDTRKIGDLGISIDGRLTSRAKIGERGGAILHPAALRQLLERAEISGASQIASAGPYLRPEELARIVNDRIGQVKPGDGATVTVKSRLSLLTADTSILPMARRTVRAILSESYADVSHADLADALGQLASNARADLALTDVGATFDLCWFTDVRPEVQVVGEPYSAGIRLYQSDVGRGAILAEAVASCLRCVNATTVDLRGVAKSSIRHVGDTQRRIAEVRRALIAAQTAVQPLLATMGLAGGIRATVDETELWERTGAYLEASQARLGAIRDVWKARYQSSPTLYKVMGAITETAQTQPASIGIAWERAAGSMAQDRRVQVRLGFAPAAA